MTPQDVIATVCILLVLGILAVWMWCTTDYHE